jgi:hypothetical protein
MLISFALKSGFVLTPNGALAGTIEVLISIPAPYYFFDTTFAEYMGTIPNIGNVLKGASAAVMTEILGRSAYSLMKDPETVRRWEAAATYNPKEGSKGVVISNNFLNESNHLSSLLSNGTTVIDIMQYCFGTIYAMNPITYLKHYYEYLNWIADIKDNLKETLDKIAFSLFDLQD